MEFEPTPGIKFDPTSGLQLDYLQKNRFTPVLIVSLITWYSLYLTLFVHQAWLMLFIIMYFSLSGSSFSLDIVPYLKNIQLSEGIGDYIKSMKNTNPELEIIAYAFHIEFNYDPHTEEDIPYRSHSYTKKEKVKIKSIEDVSSELSEELFGSNLIKVHFSLSWKPANEEVIEKLEKMKQELLSKVHGKDKESTVEIKLKIKNYRESFLALRNIHRKPKLLGFRYYAVASILTLTWFYRYWFENKMGSLKYEFRKYVYV